MFLLFVVFLTPVKLESCKLFWMSFVPIMRENEQALTISSLTYDNILEQFDKEITKQISPKTNYSHAVMKGKVNMHASHKGSCVY